MSGLEHVYHGSPQWMQTALLNARAFQIHLHRYGQQFRRATARLLEQENWVSDQLRAFQNARITAIVRYAYDHSEYYREVMTRLGLRPEDISGVADLSRLPILDKETVRRSAARLMTATAARPGWLKGHTSGTTGSPLSVWYDRTTCVVTNAVDRRQKIWAGMGSRSWIGLFLGRVVVPHHQTRPPYWRTNYLHRQVWFSSFHMTGQTLHQYEAEIRRRRLQFLEGYPSTLFILASHLKRHGRTLPMRAVITSSETLHEVQRETIESAFACRIYDFYALAERVIYAGECEAHTGKHIAEEYGFTEIVDDGGTPVPPGSSGYLVGTSFYNTAMPLIRYRTGDVSAIIEEPCSCGRTLRRIRSVTTKAEDIVVTPEGRLISPSILTHPFKPFTEIRASQIIQEAENVLLVKIVAPDGFAADRLRMFLAALQERVGSTLNIDILMVDDIPREPSGKFRWVISKVPHPCTVAWSHPSAS